MQTHPVLRSPPHLEITKNRRNGYLDAMKKYKIPVNDSMTLLCDTRERAIAITPDLLESPKRPDGFFAINDETASGHTLCLQIEGLRFLTKSPSADSPTEPSRRAPTLS